MGKNDSLKAKCANCAGAAGIASCVVPMLLSAIGVAAVGLSQGSMAGMGNTSGALTSSPFLQLISFLSGPWGAVILAGSFALMVYGMWLGRKYRPLTLGLTAAVVLFVGMYSYFSVVLQLVGAALLVVAYLAAYSHSFASALKFD